MLSDLVRAGKVRAFGTSTFSPDQLVEAQWTAEKRGHVRPSTEQPPYSILTAPWRRDDAAHRAALRHGVLTWGRSARDGCRASPGRKATVRRPSKAHASIPPFTTTNRKQQAVDALA